MNDACVCVVCWLGVRREAELIPKLGADLCIRNCGSFTHTHTHTLSLSLPLSLSHTSRRIKSLDLVCMKELEKKVLVYTTAGLKISVGLSIYVINGAGSDRVLNSQSSNHLGGEL